MIFLVAIVSYLLGSIPFGLLLAKLKKTDLREHGSGNIGATNALRVAGKLIGGLTLVLDISKGYLACYLANEVHPEEDWLPAVAILMVVIGHIFPIWLRFKGGKGMAAAIGAMAAINFHIMSIAVFVWVVAFIISGISSVSSLLACMIAGISSFLISYNMPENISILLVATLIIWRHKSNIVRLLDGTEKTLR